MTSYPLMVSISGVRGISGRSLTPDVVSKYVLAFGTLLKQDSSTIHTTNTRKKKIIVGRDSRVSGRWILPFAEGLISSLGYDVVDIGIVPTPTVQYFTMEMKAEGGLIVTSSHNPAEWNGLKFVGSDGLFLSPEKCKELFSIADAGVFDFPSYEHTGYVQVDNKAASQHIEAILALPYVNVDKIRQKKFRVVLDSVNGAGGPIMHSLLKLLGCEVVGLNLEPTGLFAHKPEPIPENLTQLCEAVKGSKADLGIAVDPDVDRCVLIDENGIPLGTVGKRGPVCKNLSSSRATDDVAAKYGCTVFAAPVGEINVAKKMVEVSAVIGGEGNGGVMLPDLHIGRDAPVAATLALQLLSSFDGPVSKLKATLPQYEICKISAPIAGIDPDAVVAHIKSKWEGKARLDESDGLRIDTDEWWVHLRKSNTEPIIRVIGEGGPYEKSLQRCNEFMKEIVSFGKPVSS